MARTFEHDSLVCHVKNVNVRKEKHGEEDVLAVDVSLRLMEAAEWDPVLRDLLACSDDEVEKWVDKSAALFDSLRFSAAYTDHKANFRYGADVLAALTHAKVNKFVMEFEDLGLTFRIQADSVTGEQVGALSELIGGKVRIEVVSLQGELELENEAA